MERFPPSYLVDVVAKIPHFPVDVTTNLNGQGVDLLEEGQWVHVRYVLPYVHHFTWQVRQIGQVHSGNVGKVAQPSGNGALTREWSTIVCCSHDSQRQISSEIFSTFYYHLYSDHSLRVAVLGRDSGSAM